MMSDTPKGLFDCAAAWDAIDPALQRKLGAALIAERRAWQGYAKHTESEGLRLIARRAATYINNIVHSEVAIIVDATRPPDMRGFLPDEWQCVRCGTPHPFLTAPPDPLPEMVCSPCWSKAARESEAARLDALRRAKL